MVHLTRQNPAQAEHISDSSHMSWYVLEPDLSIDELTKKYADIISKRTEDNSRFLAVMAREKWGRLGCKVCHVPSHKQTPYYVAWSSDPDPFFSIGGSENDQTLEQAARHMAEFVYYTRRGYNLKQIWEASAKRA